MGKKKRKQKKKLEERKTLLTQFLIELLIGLILIILDKLIKP